MTVPWPWLAIVRMFGLIGRNLLDATSPQTTLTEAASAVATGTVFPSGSVTPLIGGCPGISMR